jgi:hypothetical protein
MDRLKAAWAWLLALVGGRLWVIVVVGGLAALLIASAIIWRDDIQRTLLDPKVPFQTYDPPPAPDYASAEAWALLPPAPFAWTSADPSADVFFVHPTTYDGGSDWNGAIDDGRANRVLAGVMLPNYAGPFARVGRVLPSGEPLCHADPARRRARGAALCL